MWAAPLQLHGGVVMSDNQSYGGPFADSDAESSQATFWSVQLMEYHFDPNLPRHCLQGMFNANGESGPPSSDDRSWIRAKSRSRRAFRMPATGQAWSVRGISATIISTPTARSGLRRSVLASCGRGGQGPDSSGMSTTTTAPHGPYFVEERYLKPYADQRVNDTMARFLA